MLLNVRCFVFSFNHISFDERLPPLYIHTVNCVRFCLLLEMAIRRVFAVVCNELYSVTLFAKSTYSVTVQRKPINVCQHRHSFVVFVLLYNMHSNKILVLSMNGNNMFTIEGESLVNQQCFICLISSLLVESTLIKNADLSRI